MAGYLDKARQVLAMHQGSGAVQAKRECAKSAISAERWPPRCPTCRSTALWLAHDLAEHCQRCHPPRGGDAVLCRFDFADDPLVETILRALTDGQHQVTGN